MAKHRRIENDFIAACENCTCVQATFLQVIKQQCSCNAEQLIKQTPNDSGCTKIILQLL